jgi:hypothetical protein
VVFSYIGPVAQTAIVPPGAGAVDVRVTGGRGGGTWPYEDHSGAYVTGGDGAQVSGQIAVSPGEIMTLRVAGFGGDADAEFQPGKGGWGATGYGGRGGSGSHGDGGGGGGATSIEIRGETVVIAGGGGAGGGRGFTVGVDAGGPGGSSGATVDPGHNGKGPGAGKGGGGAGHGEPAGGIGGKGSYTGGGGGGGGAGATGGSGGGGGGFGGGGGGGGGAGSSRYTSRLEAPSVVRAGLNDGNGLVFLTWVEVTPARFGHCDIRSRWQQKATGPAGGLLPWCACGQVMVRIASASLLRSLGSAVAEPVPATSRTRALGVPAVKATV